MRVCCPVVTRSVTNEIKNQHVLVKVSKSTVNVSFFGVLMEVAMTSYAGEGFCHCSLLGRLFRCHRLQQPPDEVQPSRRDQSPG